MRSIMMLFLCASILFTTACAGKQTGFTVEDEQAVLQKKGDWTENRAVMHAAEKSGNLNVVITTGNIELKARPENDEARVRMARVYTRLGNPTQALKIVEPVQDTANTSYILEKGRATLALGQFVEAQAQINLVLAAKDPELTREAEKLQAIIYDLEGKHDKAQEQYRLLLSANAEPTVQYNYGRSLMLSKKFEEATTVFLPLVELPNLPHARLAAAACMVRSDNKKGARNLLEGYMPIGDIERIIGANE